MQHPKSFAELLAVAKTANHLSFFRARKDLSLIIDDMASDRRTCLDICLDTLTLEVKTLSGYDSKKNRWSEYCSPRGNINLPDKKGLKALVEWLKAESITRTGFPCPEALFIDR